MQITGIHQSPSNPFLTQASVLTSSSLPMLKNCLLDRLWERGVISLNKRIQLERKMYFRLQRKQISKIKSTLHNPGNKFTMDHKRELLEKKGKFYLRFQAHTITDFIKVFKFLSSRRILAKFIVVLVRQILIEYHKEVFLNRYLGVWNQDGFILCFKIIFSGLEFPRKLIYCSLLHQLDSPNEQNVQSHKSSAFVQSKYLPIDFKAALIYFSKPDKTFWIMLNWRRRFQSKKYGSSILSWICRIPSLLVSTTLCRTLKVSLFFTLSF